METWWERIYTTRQKTREREREKDLIVNQLWSKIEKQVDHETETK